jgi:hypothetical protein
MIGNGYEVGRAGSFDLNLPQRCLFIDLSQVRMWGDSPLDNMNV